MKRYIESNLYQALEKKIVFISGPRQAGKTTLAKSLFANFDYLNFDDERHREKILNRHWLRNAECIIFDELHKMKNWKAWLKGIYDTEGIPPKILVTGSAHLNTFTKVGDSLAGRYLNFRLYPIDIKEAVQFWKDDPQMVTERLLTLSGFPEPFLEGEIDFYRVWKKTHLDIIVRQDFLDLYTVRSIKNIEILLTLLAPRVASPLAYSHLAGDLQVDHSTIKSWLIALENMYALFRITPYHHNIARSLLKEPKFYFFDIARVKDFGARLENLVALSLLKSIHYLEDTKGIDASLHYLRTKDGMEVDFLLIIDDDEPILAIEVKTKDSTVSKGLRHFKTFLPNTKMVQLVYELELKEEYDTADGIEVRQLSNYLSNLNLLV